MKEITSFFNDSQLQQWGFQTDGFPDEDFSVKDERDPQVFMALNAPEYACFLMDFQDKENVTGSIAILTPYIWKNPDKKDKVDKLYGWLDKYDNFYDHKTFNIHDDNFLVVAWKKI